MDSPEHFTDDEFSAESFCSLNPFDYVEPLPEYTQFFHPTLYHYDSVLPILNQIFPAELALKIVADSHAPCLAHRGILYDFTEDLVIDTNPIPVLEGRKAVPKRIIYQIEQKTPNLVEMSTGMSPKTQSRVSIIRPYGQNDMMTGQNKATPNPLLWYPDWEPEIRRDDLRKGGWDFVEGAHGCTSWLVFDFAPRDGRHTYRIEWIKGVHKTVMRCGRSFEGMSKSDTGVIYQRCMGSSEEFLELLEPGCIVLFWTRVNDYPLNFSLNKQALGATVEIETLAPSSPSSALV
ncbi:hypothetical protein F4805DRAFT_472711 [Annulohypoxylon moriforme]|nr:hypothetical protein F4805DRAFT_472711 [Annulohypoxylon moriforme]